MSIKRGFMKALALAVAVTILSPCVSFGGSWGLGFPQPGSIPKGSETVEYLKKHDAYFVDDSGEKIIYLTFDAGYENGYTEKILDTLKANNVTAAFFLVGNYIKEHPELIKRMAADGHIVGNHTIKHPDMSEITDLNEFSKELTPVEEIYKSVTGENMKKFYRPPSGKYSQQNLEMAKELGYKTIFWSLAYSDYDNKNQPTKEMAFSKLIPRVHPGAIILLHSTSETNSVILDELIKKYREMGYEFKGLDNLAGCTEDFNTEILSNLNLQAADEKKNVYLPVLMYHQISKKSSKQGEYVISPDEFESDLKQLKDAGYTTVTVADLLNFFNGAGELPQKPVMLTFDDGFMSDYVYAFPLLKDYNMKGIFSVVGEYIDRYSQPGIDRHIDYAHLTWDEIREMRDSGLAEFQSHSYALHSHKKRRGALKRKSESPQEYAAYIESDAKALNEAFVKHLGAPPTAFTCPFGAYNDTLQAALKDNGFSVILTSQQKINKLSVEPENPLRLNRILRTHGMNIQKLIRQWDSECAG